MGKETDKYVQLYNELSDTVERLSSIRDEIEERHLAPSSRYIKLGGRYHLSIESPAEPVRSE